MRSLLLAAMLLSTGASAQTAASPIVVAGPSAAEIKSSPKSDWVHVQVLQMGTSVHIKTLDHGSIRCNVGAVDGESLTCGGVVFKRSSILYIKGSHRLRSSLVGIGAGYGVAIAITAILVEHCRTLNCSAGSAVALAVFDLAAFIATPIIFGVYDLTAGTIYRAATP